METGINYNIVPLDAVTLNDYLKNARSSINRKLKSRWSAGPSLPPLTTPEPGPERPKTPVLEDLECSICKEEYSEDRNKQPRTLPCGHTFCTQCIESVMFRRLNQSHFFPDRNNNSCPICRSYVSAVRIEDIPISYALLNVASNIKSQNDFKRKNNTKSSTNVINSAGFCATHNSPMQFWCTTCSVWICGSCAFLSHKENSVKCCVVISIEEVIGARKKLYDSEHQQLLEASNIRLSSIIKASDVCKTAIDSTSTLIGQLEESLRKENARILNLQRAKETIRDKASTIHREIASMTSLSENVRASTLYTDFVTAFKVYQKGTMPLNKSPRKCYVQFQKGTWTKNLLLECFMEHTHCVYGEEVENNIKRYFKVTASYPDLRIHSSNGLSRLPQGTIILQLSDILDLNCTQFFLDVTFMSDVEIRLNISLHEILIDYVSSFSSYFLNRRGNHFSGKFFSKLDVNPTTGSTIVWTSCSANSNPISNSEDGASVSQDRYKFFNAGTIFVPVDAPVQNLCSVFGILLNSSSVTISGKCIEIGVIKEDVSFLKENLRPDNISDLKINDCGCLVKTKKG